MRADCTQNISTPDATIRTIYLVEAWANELIRTNTVTEGSQNDMITDNKLIIQNMTL